ncbi:MAG TPA: GAF domain-containing sensor histidine kinase [Rubrobacter sp.]|nr:GAF domain-containing sensor histidine kinase [Rubrobacter sp.]
MHSQHATPRTIAPPESAAPSLRGRTLVLARAGWAVLVALNLGLFAVAVPALYAQRGAPPQAARAELAQLGISEGLYAAYFTALLVVLGLGCFVVAAVIAYRRSDDPMALFASVFLVLMGAVNHPNVQALGAAYPAWGPLLKFSWWVLWAALILFVFLFPDGRFAPRWTRVPVVLFIVGVFIALFFGEGSLTEPPDALGLVLIGGLLAGAAAQIYRYRSVSSPEGRQQTKWVVFAMATALGIQVLSLLAEPLFVRSGIPAVLYEVADATVITLAFFLIPLGIGVAILRYRLWDIDVIVNRTLVYGALTAIVVGLYVLAVGGLGALLQARGSLLISLLGAGLVAVLFAPLRDRLQRGVNRLMYGERDDPYAVLSRLGERLEATLEPRAVLPAVVETVAQALKVPYAAIALKESRGRGGFTVAAEVGQPVDAPLRLPLLYQHETVGQLLLTPRAGEDSFSVADRRLLDDLARQAGIAVHAARLTADLQGARERLVSAREEERRRLRRDLHDGLGPQLSSQTLTIDAVRALMRRDPDAAEDLLVDLKTQAQDAISDIRRLVYALRPPALDDLGLIGALRETAAQYGQNGLNVSVEASEDLSPLPAAVEVAAYRIAQEAITNVIRHAGARTCVVSLVINGDARALRFEVRDDGRGLARSSGAGVGFSSMRERAAEVGGSVVIEPALGGGTRVRAALPLPEEK